VPGKLAVKGRRVWVSAEPIAQRRPVVGSWPGKDFTTKAAGVLETELTAAGIPHDLEAGAHLNQRAARSGWPGQFA